MASVSASSLILFIAAVAVAATVSGVMVNTVADLSDSMDEKGLDVSRDISTDVEIISDPGSDAIYDDTAEEITLLVKNTGDRRIQASSAGVDVLVDGQFVDPARVSVTVADGSSWRSGNVSEVTVDRALAAGDHRVVVIVESEREVLSFHV